MATYLLGACPIYGHVAPVLAIGRHLAAQGHSVTMLTGSRFRDAVETAGLRHVALPADADFDDRVPESYMPDRAKYSGIARAKYDINTVFVSRIPGQYRGLRTLIDEVRPDAVLVDVMFTGALPLLLSARSQRPVTLGVGVMPLSQLSADAAPYGTALPPLRGPLNRIRNRALNLLVTKVLFRSVQQLAVEKLRALGVTSAPGFVMDFSALFDGFYQLSVPGFEYPRTDLASNTKLVGPVLSTPPRAASLPEWWGELDGRRPVIHVTQGTFDNHDLDRLIGPTVRALAGDDVLVVVSTGGRPVADLGPLPANVRAAEFLPYAELLPKLDVMVTNGGYGGVQQALAHGVPLVVSGDTEDKPEVGARVQHSGAGIDLRTGRPASDKVGAAVRTILADARYAARAAELAAEFARHDAVATIEGELARLTQGASAPSC